MRAYQKMGGKPQAQSGKKVACRRKHDGRQGTERTADTGMAEREVLSTDEILREIHSTKVNSYEVVVMVLVSAGLRGHVLPVK